MAISAPYTLLKRTLKSGKKVFYYRISLPSGKRSSAFSTGETTKTRAENIVRDLWKAGKLIPGNCPTLTEYTEKWFLYDECAYIQSKLKAGQSHSKSNAHNQRYWLENMILPYLGKQKISVRELKAGLTRYFQFYNSRRFHQSLDYRTPEEMYESFQVEGMKAAA